MVQVVNLAALGIHLLGMGRAVDLDLACGIRSYALVGRATAARATRAARLVAAHAVVVLAVAADLDRPGVNRGIGIVAIAGLVCVACGLGWRLDRLCAAIAVAVAVPVVRVVRRLTAEVAAVAVLVQAIAAHFRTAGVAGIATVVAVAAVVDPAERRGRVLSALVRVAEAVAVAVAAVRANRRAALAGRERTSVGVAVILARKVHTLAWELGARRAKIAAARATRASDA